MTCASRIFSLMSSSASDVGTAVAVIASWLSSSGVLVDDIANCLRRDAPGLVEKDVGGDHASWDVQLDIGPIVNGVEEFAGLVGGILGGGVVHGGSGRGPRLKPDVVVGLIQCCSALSLAVREVSPSRGR